MCKLQKLVELGRDIEDRTTVLCKVIISMVERDQPYDIHKAYLYREACALRSLNELVGKLSILIEEAEAENEKSIGPR